MAEQKSENMIVRVVFALLLVLVFSLGLMKPVVPTGFAELTPTDLVFPFLFLAWLIALATRQLRFVWHPAFVAFAIYFFALALSATFSTRPRLSVAKLAGEFYLVLLPIVVVSVVTSVESLKRTLLAWIAGAVVPIVIGLLGIVLFYTSPNSSLLGEIAYHYGSVPVGPFPRLSSTFISASMFCNYLTVAFAIVVACRWQNWMHRRTAAIITAAIIPCMALTVSIAMGGFLFTGGLLAWVVRPERIRKWIGLGLSLVSAVGFLLIAPFSLGYDPNTAVLDPSSRMLVWTDAWHRFLESPFVGSGVGTAVASVAFQNTDGTWSLLTDAHNTFLNVAGQAGIVGLTAFIFLILSVIRAGMHRGQHPLRTILLITFVAAFLYDGLTGSFEDARHLWVLIGLILAVDATVGVADTVSTGSDSDRVSP